MCLRDQWIEGLKESFLTFRMPTWLLAHCCISEIKRILPSLDPSTTRPLDHCRIRVSFLHVPDMPLAPPKLRDTDISFIPAGCLVYDKNKRDVRQKQYASGTARSGQWI
jgi:hypothetical protein